MVRPLPVIVLAAGLLAGCASKPLPRSPGEAPPAQAGQAQPDDGPWSIFAPAPPSPLAGEQRWMAQLFDGTPVLVEGEADGSVRVEVPLAYAFDDQRAAPKPPMRAVLDKITQAMLRQPRSSLQIGPPGPAARQRLAALRAHLAGKGIAGPRLVAAAPRQVDMVLLRLSPPAAALPPGGTVAR